MCGCQRVDVDPRPAFTAVQSEVICRTRFAPEWQQTSDEWIESVLDQELTIENAICVALVNNRELQATFEQLGIAKAELAQAGLLPNPVFSLAYRFATRPAASTLIDMSLLQNIIDSLLIPLKKKRAAAELEAVKANVTGAVLDLIAETSISYYTSQARQQIWHLTQNRLIAAESAYEVAEHLSAAGNIKALELAQRRAAYEQAKIAVADAEAEALQAKEFLRRVMGLWRNQCYQICSNELPSPQIEEGWEDVEVRAVHCSLDLAVSRYRLIATAAKFGVDTTKVVMPTLDLGVSAEREEGTWFVGPALNLPLPIFDTGRAMSAAAQSEIRQQWDRYAALAIKIRSEARMGRLRLLNALRKSRYYHEIIVPVMQQLTRLTLHQYNAMQIGVFHLLATKDRELETQVEAVNTLLNYWVAKTELELLAVGHLREKRM